MKLTTLDPNRRLAVQLVAACVLGLLVLLQVARPAAAGFTFTQAVVSAGVNARDLAVGVQLLANNDNDEDVRTDGGAATATASAPLDRGTAHSLATADAVAQVGHLGVKVSGFADDPIGAGLGSAAASSSAIAEWDDEIQIFAAGHLGIRAVFDVSIVGLVGAMATGQILNGQSAGASANVRILNSFNSQLAFTPINIVSIDAPATGTFIHDPIPPSMQVTIFPQGPNPFKIGMRMEAGGTAGAVGTGDGVALYAANLFRSVTWGGLVGVFDAATGERLEDYTITSASGFDFTKPFSVPEPSSLAMLAGLIPAGALLGLCFRRRRRAPRGRSFAEANHPGA